MTDKIKILDTLFKFKKHIESLGYTVYAVMLKGSQNYNLSDNESDIDANAILIPTIRQLRTGIKEKIEFPEGEVTCHDIYSFAEIVAKGNPQWVEVCNTPYYIGKPIDLFSHYKVNPSALKGMVMEKVTAFCKLYPSRAHMVEKFGYDPKQLHHIIRLCDILYLDVKIHRYSGTDRDWMMDVKRGRVPATKEDAFKMRDMYLSELKKIYHDKKMQYKPQTVNYDTIDAIVMDYYKK